MIISQFTVRVCACVCFRACVPTCAFRCNFSELLTATADMRCPSNEQEPFDQNTSLRNSEPRQVRVLMHTLLITGGWKSKLARVYMLNQLSKALDSQTLNHLANMSH